MSKQKITEIEVPAAPMSFAQQSVLAENAAAYIVLARTLHEYGYPVPSEADARELVETVAAINADPTTPASARVTDEAFAGRLAFGIQELFARAGIRKRAR